MERDAVKAAAERRHLGALVRRDVRHVLDLHGQQHDALVQHLVVLHVVQQRRRDRRGRRGQEHRCAAHAVHGLAGRRDEHGQRHGPFLQPLAHDPPAGRPGRQQREDHQADRDRQQRAFQQLGEPGGEEDQVDRDEHDEADARAPQRRAPDAEHHDILHQRRDQHRPHHRQPIGRQHRRRMLERDDEQRDGRRQRPIDRRQIDLPARPRRGVADLQARHEAELDRLLRHRKGAGDHRLAGDHRGERRDHQQRDRERRRDHVEERIVHIVRMADQHRRLAHVVEHQRGDGDPQPRDRDRLAPEMPHVRVERLRARHRVDHRAERQERVEGMRGEERPQMDRAERREHGGIARDMDQAHRRDRREIDEHDRAEQPADALGAVPLDREQADQDGERDPHHIRLERRADDAQPFDRRDDRDRGRQHRVGVEQRGRGQRPDQQQPPGRGGAQLAVDQRVEREAAALAAIVAAHDDEDVFDRHHEHERPEDQADDAVQVGDIDAEVIARVQRRLQRVERAGADVPEHDADCAQRQGGDGRGVRIARRADGWGGVRHARAVRRRAVKIPWA